MNYQPGRPSPRKFQARPTLPVKISNPADPTRISKNVPETDPTRTGTLPDGQGRGGLQYSNTHPFEHSNNNSSKRSHSR
jgi:hypothetical protein